MIKISMLRAIFDKNKKPGRSIFYQVSEKHINLTGLCFLSGF